MREKLQRLAGDAGVYGFGQFVGRGVQLLLVPFLTRAMPQDAYGVVELIIAYTQTAALVLVFGLDGALARFFYGEPDRAARVRLASSVLSFRLGASLAAAALVALAATPLASDLFGSEVYRKYVLVAAVTLPFSLLVLFANDVLRITFQPWKFITLNVTQAALTTGVSLWLVLGMELGVVGVFYGRLVTDAFCALLGLVLVRHTARPTLRLGPLGRLLRYGLPAIPSAFAFGVIASLGPYALQRTRSLAEVAIYAVAFKFFAVVSVGISAFQLSYGASAFAHASSPDAPRFYARVFALFVALASTVALAAGLFAPEALAVLVPPAYRPAAGPAAWLAFAAVAQGVYFVSSIGAALALRTVWVAGAAVAAAIVAAAAQFALAPRFGPDGAAVATFLGYATVAGLTYAVSQRVHPLPLPGRGAALVAGAAILLALLGQRLAPAGAIGFVLRLVLVVAFGGVVFRIWLRAPSPAAVLRALAGGTRPHNVKGS